MLSSELLLGLWRHDHMLRPKVDGVVDSTSSGLGFIKKTEVPLGDHRWLTVVSPDEPNGTELVLEPAGHPAIEPFRSVLRHDGIPFTSFAVADVQEEFERLSKQGVRFTQEPTSMGPVTTAVLDDTVGNLIQIASSPQG